LTRPFGEFLSASLLFMNGRAITVKLTVRVKKAQMPELPGEISYKTELPSYFSDIFSECFAKYGLRLTKGTSDVRYPTVPDYDP
jgi:hypothetical protein